MRWLEIKQIKPTVAAVAFILSLSACSSDLYGARVVMRNSSTTPLHSVTVRVTGNSYAVGELPAFGSCSVKTYPTSESNIIIEHMDTSGENKELPVDCYFEPGHRSTIVVSVTADSAVKIN